MQAPVITHALAEQLEASKADYIESWLTALRNLPGNPFEVAIEHFGHARAFAARQLAQVGLFNRVIGLIPEDSELLDDILLFYSKQGVGYRIDISPYRVNAQLLAHLAKRGLQQSLFQTQLYSILPLEPPSVSPSITIREVTSQELELFSKVYIAGFREALRGSEAMIQRLGTAVRMLYGSSGWSIFLALVDEEPAGAGLLYVQDSIASLAGGATLPAFRQKGCQTALISHRITRAMAEGCSLLVGQAGVGSVSQMNMERVGLRVAYTRTMWTPS